MLIPAPLNGFTYSCFATKMDLHKFNLDTSKSSIADCLTSETTRLMVQDFFIYMLESCSWQERALFQQAAEFRRCNAAVIREHTGTSLPVVTIVLQQLNLHMESWMHCSFLLSPCAILDVYPLEGILLLFSAPNWFHQTFTKSLPSVMSVPSIPPWLIKIIMNKAKRLSPVQFN